jgi:hypothetical protein
MVSAAIAHAQQLYGADALSLEEVQRWIAVNPYVLGVLTAGSQYEGYLDVLPLSRSGSELIRSRTGSERMLGAGHILVPGQMRSAACLYVASLAVREHGTPAGHARASALFLGLAIYLRTLYGEASRAACGLVATPEGERVVRRWGAKLVQAAGTRGDGLTLYEFDLEPSQIESTARRSTRPGGPISVEMAAP